MNKRTASTIMIFSIFALALFASCASSQQVKNSDIYIEDKGTAEGITVPQWVQISLTGNIRDIEKLPDYKGMNVAVVQFDAQDRSKPSSTPTSSCLVAASPRAASSNQNLPRLRAGKRRTPNI